MWGYSMLRKGIAFQRQPHLVTLASPHQKHGYGPWRHKGGLWLKAVKGISGTNPPSPPHRQGSPPLGSPPSGQQSEFTEHCLHWASVSAVSMAVLRARNWHSQLPENSPREFSSREQRTEAEQRYRNISTRDDSIGRYLYSPPPRRLLFNRDRESLHRSIPKPNPHQVMLTFWGDGNIFSNFRIVFISPVIFPVNHDWGTMLLWRRHSTNILSQGVINMHTDQKEKDWHFPLETKMCAMSLNDSDMRHLLYFYF